MMPDSAEVGLTPIETSSAGRTEKDSTPDELEWPIGPEGNEEGGMPAAGAAEETISETLTG